MPNITDMLISKDAWMELSPNKSYEIYLATHMALEGTKKALEDSTEKEGK